MNMNYEGSDRRFVSLQRTENPDGEVVERFVSVSVEELDQLSLELRGFMGLCKLLQDKIRNLNCYADIDHLLSSDMMAHTWYLQIERLIGSIRLQEDIEQTLSIQKEEILEFSRKHGPAAVKKHIVEFLAEAFEQREKRAAVDQSNTSSET